MLVINGRSLNLATGELTYLGETTLLEAKVLAVFNVLYASKGDLVSQETIFAQVWADTVVAPNALQRCIAQLRKHLGDEHKTLLQTFPKKGYRLQPDQTPIPARPKQQWYYATFLLLSAILCVVVVQGLLISKHSYEFSVIQALTYGSANEQHGILFDEQLIYIERGQTTTSLMLKDTRTEQSKVLHSAADYKGVPSISPDGKRLAAVALVLRADKQKCTQVVTFQLAIGTHTPVLPCPSFAIQQLHWTGNDSILAITDNRIFALEPTSKTLSADLLPIKLKQIAGSYLQGTRLYVMGLDQQSTPRLWLFVYNKEKSVLTLTKQSTLPYKPDETTFFTVTQDGTLVHQHNGYVYIYQDVTLSQSLPVAGNSKLQFTATTATDQLLATSIRTDQQVMFRAQNNSLVFATPFDEHDAQFQPNGRHIAFISDRSGQDELWLSEGNEVRRLSPGSAISSFVWQQDGTAAWALGAEYISKFPLDAPPQRVAPAGTVEILLQHVQTPDGGYLLARDKNARLILIDLNRQIQQVLFSGAVHWAQISNTGQIFIATPDSPSIKVLKNTETSDITALQLKVLQWRFYFRDGKLLFADKQGDIIAYNPRNDEVQLLDHYDEDTRMATDIQLAPLRLLANTTGAEQANQVLLTLTLR